MATWIAPYLHATGDAQSVTDYNTIVNDLLALFQKPYGFYYNSAATSVTNETWTQVSLGGTTKSGYGFTLSSNTAVVPIAGTIDVDFAVSTSGTSGIVLAGLYVNGAAYAWGSSGAAWAGGGWSSGSCKVACNAGAALGLWVFQSSGGTVTTSASSLSTFLHAQWTGSS